MDKNDFLTKELDRLVDLTKHYRDQKLEYKKLYVAALSVALTVTLIIQRFPAPIPESNVGSLNEILPSDRLIGVVFALQAMIGLFIAKTLASLRSAGTFHHNCYVQSQREIRSSFELQRLPTLKEFHPVNRQGADYLSILAISVCSCLFFVFGVSFIGDSFKQTSYWIPLVAFSAYVLGHCKIIDATLSEAPEWGSNNPVSEPQC